jgi:shikimate 5-dehydrogenase
VLDLVYRAGGTEWVRAARARGLAAADGTVMLVEQGAASFERWFGITPDRAVMWSSLAD